MTAWHAGSGAEADLEGQRVGTGVVVRAPATSANLGPGFDALGLALDLHDEVTATLTGDGLRVQVTGEGAGELPTDQTHLVVRAIDAALAALAAPRPPGLLVTCHNRIPQARGLGSSSAAIVAGLLVGRALVPGAERRLDPAALLRLATDLEGHPDNAAACLFGGFTIAWRDPAGAARAVRLAPHPDLAPTLFVPDRRGLTAAARAALPATVPHPDAAHTAGRAALLVHALTAAPDLLPEATEDRLHQPYRAAAAPGTAALVRRLRAAGVAAVVSGAGPTVLALTPVPPRFEPGEGWTPRPMGVVAEGASVRAGTLGR